MTIIDPNDPAQNATAPTNVAEGARINEFTFRHLVSWALKRIHETIDNPDENIIEELFGTLPDEERDQIKRFIRENPNITTAVNWPPHDVKLPVIAFINGQELEDQKFTLLGDHVGFATLGSVGAQVISRECRGVGLDCETQIWILSEDSNLTLYLYWLVRFIMFVNKLDLHRYYGVRDLILNGQDLRWDESLWPTFAYIKVIGCKYGSFFDYNLPEERSKFISLSLAVATNFTVAGTEEGTDLGPATITDVPYTEE